MTDHEPSLIDAIALAIARALAAHGVTPEAGNPTVRAQCQALCGEWGGGRHYLPRRWRTGTRAEIAEGLAEGHSARAIAQRVGIPERTAQDIASRKSRATGFGRDDWVL